MTVRPPQAREDVVIGQQEESPPRGRSGRFRGAYRHRRFLLGVAAGAVLTASVLTLLQWPWTDVTDRSRQPSATAYGDGSPHYLGLKRRHTLSGQESYSLMIGRDPGLSYGHLLDVDSDLAAEGIEKTEWTRAGVRVRFTTGHTLFVPARAFTYGR